jgi:hypothetical protein
MAESTTSTHNSNDPKVLEVLGVASNYLPDSSQDTMHFASQLVNSEGEIMISPPLMSKNVTEATSEEFEGIDPLLNVPLIIPPPNHESDCSKELREDELAATNTHDVTLVEEHIPNIERFADDLQLAINAAWPTRGEGRYNAVQVLILSWADDNLGVEKEIRRLAFVFSNLYGFVVHEFRIPRKTPGRSTTSRISSFLESESRETLFIVYYAGHAGLGSQVNDPPIWAA